MKINVVSLLHLGVFPILDDLMSFGYDSKEEFLQVLFLNFLLTSFTSENVHKLCQKNCGKGKFDRILLREIETIQMCWQEGGGHS